MFDLPLPIHPTTGVRGPPVFPLATSIPTALRADPVAPRARSMSGRAPTGPRRFATLARPCRARSIMPRGWPRMPRPSFWRSLIATSALCWQGRQRRGRRLVPSGDQRGRGAGVVTKASQLRRRRAALLPGASLIWCSSCAPRRSSGCAARRSALARLRRPGAAGRGVSPRDREGQGDLELCRGRVITRPASPLSLTGNSR